MKIACMIYASMEKAGGAEVFTLNLLGKFSEFGHKVTLYLTDVSYQALKSQIKAWPFRVRPLIYQTGRISIYLPLLMKKLINDIQRKEKYCLWQIVGAYPAGYIASTLSGKVPLVLRTHGEDIQKNFELNYGVRLNPATEKKIQKSVNSMNRVISMTENMRNCYLELKVRPEKIVKIPNAVNIERFELSTDKSATRERYNLPQNTTLLITVGRYHIKKGHDLIPSIAERLRKQSIDFKWLLIGAGLNRLKNEVERKGLSDYIILKDEIGIQKAFDKNGEVKIPGDELIELLKSSDIFVFPTRLEGFPMVLLEAMAAGVPVVTTNSPGVKEIVAHNKTALLSEIDDLNSMVANIIRLVRDNSLKEKLINQAKEELPRYGLNNIAKQYLNLYTQLIRCK